MTSNNGNVHESLAQYVADFHRPLYLGYADEAEQEAYRDVLAAAMRYEASIDLHICHERALAIVDDVRMEVPEFSMWVESGTVSYTKDEPGVCVYKFSYRLPFEEALRILKSLDSMAHALMTEIGEACELAKELEIHDFIVEHMVYENRGPDSYTLQGFLDGKGVCSSFAHAFKYLCDRAGLQSERVHGSLNGVAHAFNACRVDGAWFFVDVTADSNKGKLPFDYVNVSAEELAADGKYEWDPSPHSGECQRAFGYWERAGLFVRSASQLESVVRSGLEREGYAVFQIPRSFGDPSDICLSAVGEIYGKGCSLHLSMNEHRGVYRVEPPSSEEVPLG